MSDTPRTDAESNGGNSMAVLMGNGLRDALVQSDFARQLERELTDARQIASKYDDRYFATRQLLTVSTERAEWLERELNEARTRIKELADIGGALAAQIEVEAIGAPGSVRRVREWQETVKRCLEWVE